MESGDATRPQEATAAWSPARHRETLHAGWKAKSGPILLKDAPWSSEAPGSIILPLTAGSAPTPRCPMKALYLPKVQAQSFTGRIPTVRLPVRPAGKNADPALAVLLAKVLLGRGVVLCPSF